MGKCFSKKHLPFVFVVAATADGLCATKFVRQNRARIIFAVAFGNVAVVCGNVAVVCGNSADGFGNVADGFGNSAVAFGNAAYDKGNGAVSIGNENCIFGNCAVACGKFVSGKNGAV